MKVDVENILLPTAAVFFGGSLLFFIHKHRELQEAYCALALSAHAAFPYTVEGMKQRGLEVPPLVQELADTIEANHQAWYEPSFNGWTR
jgi:hypothetical protein